MSTHQTPSEFVIVTVVVASTAAVAAAGSLVLMLPVWAMFIGWIAFYTRGLTTCSTLENLACVAIGTILSAGAALVIAKFVPVVGPIAARSSVVFAVALLVVTLRGLPVLNNLHGYFLGLVAWCAAGMEPSLTSIAQLLCAIAIGSVAGWVSHKLPADLLH